MRYLGLLVAFVLVAGCSVPRVFQLPEVVNEAGGKTVHRIFVVTQRTLSEVTADRRRDVARLFGEDRSTELNYAFADISVPPTHAPGRIELPARAFGTANPETDFVAINGGLYSTISEFRGGLLEDAATHPGDDILVFVHGYNQTVPEAAFRLTQIVEDFEVPMPAVLFSWPSAGRTGAYVYDKDSVLFARDDLVAFLRDLSRVPGRDVVLAAHSMGTQLTMEALRQLALEGDLATLRRIDMLVLMSPDIDPDVFLRQLDVIEDNLPVPFLILINSKDRALRVSSLLTGGRGRLGAVLTPDVVAGRPISVIDVSALSDGTKLDHLAPVTSPEAIRILRNLAENQAVHGGGFADFLTLGDDR